MEKISSEGTGNANLSYFPALIYSAPIKKSKVIFNFKAMAIYFLFSFRDFPIFYSPSSRR